MSAARKKKASDHTRTTKLVTVTLIRSVHGQLQNIAASVRGLGLRKPHQSVAVVDNPQNRGMINRAVHLLKVEEA